MAATFCIVTTYSDNYDIGYLAQKRNSFYAKLHGYDFICQVKSCWQMWPEIAWSTGKSSLSWCKIPLIIQAMEEKKHDWILWIDADAIVINDNLTLDVVLESTGVKPHHNFIIAKDLTKCCRINGGVFFIRNTDYMRTFLADMWSCAKAKGRKFLSKKQHEQSQFEREIRKLNGSILKEDINTWNEPGIRECEHFLICDNRHLNNNMMPCDFIYHAACTDEGSKEAALKKAIKEFGCIQGGELIDLPLWQVQPLRPFRFEEIVAPLRASEFPFANLSSMRLTDEHTDDIIQILNNSKIRHVDVSMNGNLAVSRILVSVPHLEELDACDCDLEDGEPSEIARYFVENPLCCVHTIDLFMTFSEMSKAIIRDAIVSQGSYHRCLEDLDYHPKFGNRCKIDTLAPEMYSNGHTLIIL